MAHRKTYDYHDDHCEREPDDDHDEKETIYFWTFFLEKNMNCQNSIEWAIRIYYGELISIFSDHEMRNVDDHVHDCEWRCHPHYQWGMR